MTDETEVVPETLTPKELREELGLYEKIVGAKHNRGRKILVVAGIIFFIIAATVLL